MTREKNHDGQIPRPLIGIGVMILNDKNEVLLGLRNSSHGAGEWAFPGGHLEFGETILETAQREVAEETGLTVTEFTVISICDEMRYILTDKKHYVNISVLGKYQGGNPEVKEPKKLEQWQWFAFNQLPSNLFEASEYAIRNFQDGKIYQPGLNI